MCKAQNGGMKRLAREGVDHSGPRDLAGYLAATSICLIAHKGVPDMSHVHPDLVSASGLQLAGHQGHRTVRFDDMRPRDCMATAREKDRLALPVGLMARELRGDLERSAFETNPALAAKTRIGGIRGAVTDGEIFALHTVVGELRGEPMMGAIGLRDHQDAGGILVDAVHDAGALFAANAGQVAAKVVQQRIDQRARRAARCGVDDHSSRLVDDDEVAVFEKDIEGDVFGLRINLGGFFDGNLDQIAFHHLGLWVGNHCSVHCKRACGDQFC